MLVVVVPGITSHFLLPWHKCYYSFFFPHKNKSQLFQLYGQQWNPSTTSKAPFSCSLWRITKKARTWPQLEQTRFIALLRDKTDSCILYKWIIFYAKMTTTHFFLFVTNTEQFYMLLLNNSPMHVIAILVFIVTFGYTVHSDFQLI